MKKALLFVVALLASAMVMPTTYALDYVASVDGNNYETLQEAINNANGKTVTLLSDVTESVTISKETTVTLDLGKYTLTNIEGQNTITNNGNLTIIGSGTVDNVSHGKGAIVNKGVAILQGPSLTRSQEAGSSSTNNGGNSWYVVDNNGGTFYMESGKIESTSRYSSCIRNLGATFYMNGGELSSNFITLKNDDNGIIYMTGGTVNTNDLGGSGIQNWGTLEVTGGSINAVSGAVAIYTLSWDDKYTQPTTLIDKDAVINGNVLIDIDGNPTIYPEVTVNDGQINGSVIDRIGTVITINGGDITGTITTTEGSDLQIKRADYSKINELVLKVEGIDKTKYTEDSVKVLEDIINGIDVNKTILEQDYVDNKAKEIEAAINGLVKKVEDLNPSEDPDKENQGTEIPEFPEVNLPDKDIKDEVKNPKTADSISYAYIALLISGLGVVISLKRLA